MRAGELIAHRSGNCSSSVTGSAGEPSYKRTRLVRSKGKLGPARVVPLGGMPPSGPFWTSQEAEVREKDYQNLKIQGQAARLTRPENKNPDECFHQSGFEKLCFLSDQASRLKKRP
jgi:hypothetical protein